MAPASPSSADLAPFLAVAALRSTGLASTSSFRERHRPHTSVLGLPILERVPPSSGLPAVALAAIAVAMLAMPMLVGCGDNIHPAEQVDGGSLVVNVDDPNGDPDPFVGSTLRTDDVSTSVGLEHALVVWAVDAAGHMVDVSKRVTWIVSDPSIATIDDNDTLHGAKLGHTAAIAALGTKQVEFMVDVGDAVVTSITVNPPRLSIGVGVTLPLAATGHFSDGHSEDVTSLATWTAEDDGFTAVDTGRVTGMAFGTTSVHASVGEADGEATVEVTGCHVVINEVKTGTLLLTRDEFIELYNPCAFPVALSQTRLVYRVVLGLVDISLGDLTGTIEPGAYKVYGGTSYIGLSDGSIATDLASLGGAIALRTTTTGETIDGVGWGASLSTLVEGTVALVVPSGQSLARTPNGHDSDNNGADFAADPTPSPGAPN